jgi:tight adherence protein C
VSPPLVAAAVLLAFAAAWQLAGERGEEIGAALRRIAGRVTAGRVRSLAEAALALGVPERLERAGLARSLAPSAVVAAKAAGAAVGIGAALAVLPSLPARLDAVAVPVLAVAGFLGPDAWLERAARLRRARLVAALPDALDLLAVGAASGRAPAAVLRELAAQGSGPLAVEVAVAVAELDCGASQDAAMAALRERAPGAEVGAMAAALERSRRYGSPLAEQLHEQASALRRDARRGVEESASRAAPKIQLVVALVLVPSVLLMILAAIVAHADALFGAV